MGERQSALLLRAKGTLLGMSVPSRDVWRHVSSPALTPKDYLRAIEYTEELLLIYEAQSASLRNRRDEEQSHIERSIIDNSIAGSEEMTARLRHVLRVLKDASQRRARRRPPTRAG